ncbi:hypothetical protein AGMMS50255_8890 [Spirochaetia bacterium]|nr:hypothetical protein AGMMS50255_8890 [Spirochaetia bacterium]
MADVIFSPIAMHDYMEWQTKDRKTSKKINDLIEDIQRNGFMKGKGKPEPLKHIWTFRPFGCEKIRVMPT